MAVFLDFFTFARTLTRTLTRTFRTIRTIRTIRTTRTTHDRVRVRENCVFQAVREVFRRFVGAVTRPFPPPFHRFFGAVTRTSPPLFHRFVGAVTRTHTTVPPVLRQFHPATIPPFCPNRPNRPKCPNRPHGHSTVPPVRWFRHPSCPAPFHRFSGAVTRTFPPLFSWHSGSSTRTFPLSPVFFSCFFSEVIKSFRERTIFRKISCQTVNLTIQEIGFLMNQTNHHIGSDFQFPLILLFGIRF